MSLFRHYECIDNRERGHTCLRSLESDMLEFTSAEDDSSFISSAKDRGGLNVSAFSSN